MNKPKDVMCEIILTVNGERYQKAFEVKYGVNQIMSTMVADFCGKLMVLCKAVVRTFNTLLDD